MTMHWKGIRGLKLIICFGWWHAILFTASSRIVQRSDGCGPHPLVALVAASKPYGSGGLTSLNEVLRTVKANPDVWATMSVLLRRYDDCIRAGDGLHYKRTDPTFPSFQHKLSSSGEAREVLSLPDTASQLASFL